ncbi:protein c-Fos-like [Mustelus asterias]
MFQPFSTEYDSVSRCSNSPSMGDPHYYSPADSFTSLGSPASNSSTPDFCSELGSSFVPTLTALSSRQELQWMVQPTGLSLPSVTQSRIHPYSSGHSDYPLSRASLNKHSGRRGKAEQLSPEDEEKRKVRRERNKLAAAKCRNRRRELTDSLQTETEQLEGQKSTLETEIAELLKEKERLEFILAAHRPVCRLPEQEGRFLPNSQRADPQVAAFPAPAAAQDSSGPAPDLLSGLDSGRSVPDVDLISLADWEPLYSSLPAECEPLCTPVLPDTPSGSYSSSFTFNYPEISACGSLIHSASGSEHSSDSLNSPTLLAL